jgi:hypothetical protein
MDTILDRLKQLTVTAAIGYAISWTYFFATLSLFQGAFGKVKGAGINYGISWLVWIAASAGLTLMEKRGTATSSEGYGQDT